MHAASLVATGFSIVTAPNRTRIMAKHLDDRYGMNSICRQIWAIDLPVLDLETVTAKTAILQECRRAIAEDGCGAIVLGCGGMADLSIPLSQDLGIPVIDSVSVAVKFVEALVCLGIGTSGRFSLSLYLDRQRCPSPDTNPFWILNHFCIYFCI